MSKGGIVFGLTWWAMLAIVLTILVGGACAAYLIRRYAPGDFRITPVEYVVVSLVLIMLVMPSVGKIAHAIAEGDSVGGYQEFWNGSITAAESRTITCERDGDCTHTYRCDPYQDLETYTEQEPRTRQVSTTDSKGHTTYRTETYYVTVTKQRWVTKYHDCPYATHEYSYWLKDSLGQTHDIASHIFAVDARQWRGGEGIPGDVMQGIPPRWLSAKLSLEQGDAPPVTKLSSYRNYLLASSDSLLRQYSDQIDKYREKNLLPYHTKDLMSDPVKGYSADKMVFVGMESVRYQEWQDVLARLNSQLGTERQGDLHVVAMPAHLIDSPDEYVNALLAYWQSRQMGKMGIAKNAIVLVVGVSDDQKTVEWARAKTGIPEGNGEMLSAFSTRLADTSFEPRSLLGWPKANYVGGKLSFTASGGTVERIVLHDYPYKRPCMDCTDKDDNGSGYVYLKSSAYLSTATQIWTIVIVLFISVLAFALAALAPMDRWFMTVGVSVRRTANTTRRRMASWIKEKRSK